MSHTFRFFALPSFMEGVGSVIDIAGSFHNYNCSQSPHEADFEALNGDWKAIEKDFSDAFESLRKEVNEIE